MTIPANVRYLVLDSETSGLEYDRGDRMVELAWVEVDENFNIIDRQQSLLDPQCLISPSASAVHGIEAHHVQDSPTVEEFFSLDHPGCYGKPITDPVVLIGHRIAFDHRFVKDFIPNVVQEVCSLRWVRRLYPQADNHQLGTMVYSLDLPRSEGAHRAMADVMTAYYLARHICERTNMTLRQLAEASAEPMEVQIMSFGKWKGTPIKEMPAPYLRWMLDKLALDEDMTFSVRKALESKRKEAA